MVTDPRYYLVAEQISFLISKGLGFKENTLKMLNFIFPHISLTRLIRSSAEPECSLRPFTLTAREVIPSFGTYTRWDRSCHPFLCSSKSHIPGN